MSRNDWFSPDDVLRRKKRKKQLIYISIMIGTVLLSTVVTLLANKI